MGMFLGDHKNFKFFFVFFFFFFFFLGGGGGIMPDISIFGVVCVWGGGGKQ